MTAYYDELIKAMDMLAADGYVFVGQSVGCAGTAMTNTFANVPEAQKLEFPVMESTQLGFCTGIALAGGKVCSVFPRINFFLEATGQLVQHLDKIPLFSDYCPRVIIRTSVATDNPLDPGPQHLGDYTEALKYMLSTVKVVRLHNDYDIVPAYKEAMNADFSTILVEYSEKFL